MLEMDRLARPLVINYFFRMLPSWLSACIIKVEVHVTEMKISFGKYILVNSDITKYISYSMNLKSELTLIIRNGCNTKFCQIAAIAVQYSVYLSSCE